jgi:hypothetical protein
LGGNDGGTNDGGYDGDGGTPLPPSNFTSGAGDGSAATDTGERASATDAGREAAAADPATCETDCQVAASVGCDVDELATQLECKAVCATSPTQRQLDCLQASPCSAFVKALQGRGVICGIPAIDASVGAFASCENACTRAVNVAFAASCYLDPTTADDACTSLCRRGALSIDTGCFHDITCLNLLAALDGGSVCPPR